MTNRRATDAPLADVATILLGLDPKEPEVARAAVLRRLRDDDFFPDVFVQDAITTRSGHGTPAPRIVATEEEWLCEGADAFAANFFNQPVNDRRAHWEALARLCGRHGGLKDRLDDLAPGLGVDFDGFADPSEAVARLADDVRALFILPRRERAAAVRVRARAFRAAPNLTDRDRARAVSTLSRHHKPIAALADGYLERLVWPYQSLRKGPKPHRTGLLTPAGPEGRSAREIAVIIFLIAATSRGVIKLAKQLWITPRPAVVAATAEPGASFAPTPPVMPLPLTGDQPPSRRPQAVSEGSVDRPADIDVQSPPQGRQREDVP